MTTVRTNLSLFAKCFVAFALLLGMSLQAQQVIIDTISARATLAALQNPNLTYDQAMAVAKLEGNQGMIKKMRELKEADTDEQFAQALLAVAHGQPASSAAERSYNFLAVKDAASAESNLLAQIENSFEKEVSEGIRPYSPKIEMVPLRGFVVVGGDGGGYAFGGSDFYLNALFTDDVIDARQTMIHEAFHGVQGAVYHEDTAHWTQESAKPSDRVLGQFCSNVAELFLDLRDEGTAKFVGSDEPLKDSKGATGKRIYSEVLYYNQHVRDSAALLEVSVASLEAPKPVPFKTVYGVDFFGKGVVYYIGDTMTSAIAEQDGPGGVAEVVQKPGYEFVLRYTRLKSYGIDNAHPRLGENTVRAAQLLHDGCRTL